MPVFKSPFLKWLPKKEAEFINSWPVVTPFIQPEVYKDGGICKCSRSCHVFHKQQQILEAGSCLSLTAACQDQWSVSPTGVLYSVFRFFHVFFNYWVHMQGCSRVWYPKQSGPFNWKMLPEQGKNPPVLSLVITFSSFTITENFIWCISSQSLCWCQVCSFPEVRV